MKITTPVIPVKQQFIGKNKTLDYQAICVFVATGFFLGDDTYYKEQRVLQPARHYDLDYGEKALISETPYFKWHYSPIERPFEAVLQEFCELFEQIVFDQVNGKQVILPLSGGLDSRTQAVALKRLGIQTHAFSYTFKGGHDETRYGAQIAKACGFPFQAFTVPKGYLWDSIEWLADLNGCYSEFTHPRQMAFIDHYGAMGDVFSLGHWGDVLFDDMGVPDDLSLDAQIAVIYKKIIKREGLVLANKLWRLWGISGDFEPYLRSRITHLLTQIDIPHSANARIRAFKSLYWAPRWTSVNLCVFEAVKPIHLPYYDLRMCEFICSVPERFLANRQLQIAYIKRRMPELAKIPWQEQRPFNLYTYLYNKFPWNVPYRVLNKIQRMLQSDKFVQRNWELQFLGSSNETHLRYWLFDQPDFHKLISKDLVEATFQNFKNSDGIHTSHAVSMLLTLSLFAKQNEI